MVVNLMEVQLHYETQTYEGPRDEGVTFMYCLLEMRTKGAIVKLEIKDQKNLFMLFSFFFLL